ncbi:MAG: GNAT family N-acetyltransferase [Bacteroidales bacterium]|nr:GNAT family N-acetyltransferase [Bacteroidales bacterium]
MNFIIRKASLDDISNIKNVADIIFPYTYKNILSKDQIEYMMNLMYSIESLNNQFTIQNYEYFLAENNYGEILGYMSCKKNDNAILKLEKLYILPNYQRIGIGNALFFKAIEIAKNKKLFHIQLNVNRNNNAINFYKKIGMYIASQGDFDIGNGYFMNDYIMQYDI